MGKLSTKIDVYSYGVVLMEIITGRKVIDNSLPQNAIFLVPVFRTNFLDEEKFRNTVDPTLELNDSDWNSLLEVARLAYHCTEEEPESRPSMPNCVAVLSKMVHKWNPKEIGSDKGESSSMGLKQQVEKWKMEDLTADTTSG